MFSVATKQQLHTGAPYSFCLAVPCVLNSATVDLSEYVRRTSLSILSTSALVPTHDVKVALMGWHATNGVLKACPAATVTCAFKQFAQQAALSVPTFRHTHTEAVPSDSLHHQRCYLLQVFTGSVRVAEGPFVSDGDIRRRPSTDIEISRFLGYWLCRTLYAHRKHTCAALCSA